MAVEIADYDLCWVGLKVLGWFELEWGTGGLVYGGDGAVAKVNCYHLYIVLGRTLGGNYAHAGSNKHCVTVFRVVDLGDEGKSRNVRSALRFISMGFLDTQYVTVRRATEFRKDF